MSAFEWFEGMAALRYRLQCIDASIESAYSYAGPHSPQFAPTGGRGYGDRLTGVDRIIDGCTREMSDRLHAELERMERRARAVLYGRSRRGGLAKARSDTDADILFCHYLQGESWASIARRFEPETANLTVWCKRKAVSACKFIDRVGMDALIDT